MQHEVEHLIHPRAGEQWCEPQLLLRFPGDPPEVGPPHIDEEPPWANGRKYRCIVGVALSRSWLEDGALLVHTDTGVEPVEMNTGDIVVMHPSTPHCGGPNVGCDVRYMVYFRLLYA